jgi:hypothetical protein
MSSGTSKPALYERLGGVYSIAAVVDEWLRVGQSFPRIGTPMTVAGTSMPRASPPPQAWPLQPA